MNARIISRAKTLEYAAIQLEVTSALAQQDGKELTAIKVNKDDLCIIRKANTKTTTTTTAAAMTAITTLRTINLNKTTDGAKYLSKYRCFQIFVNSMFVSHVRCERMSQISM